ncbi:MAG: hypothetical protein ACW98K_14000 [Candidatus Kariarchaeaceae archaeon]|jgi:hypothetical protein
MPTSSPIDVSKILVEYPRIIFSTFVPLGENSIIQLVDNFRKNDEVTIEDADYYYFVKARYKDVTYTLYSRGLITIEIETHGTHLNQLIKTANELAKTILENIDDLLDKYHMSLVEVIGDIEHLPMHKTIVVHNFSGPGFSYVSSLRDLTEEELDSYKDDLLEQISIHPKIKEFIGDTRSIDSKPHEDVIIGTEGSIVRSEDITHIISYHCYNRGLHLFLNRYNAILREVWSNLNIIDDELHEYGEMVTSPKSRFNFISMFSVDYHKQLGDIKTLVLNGVKNIDNFLIMTDFIEDSILFTDEKYETIRVLEGIRENEFHVRKTLGTLRDRGGHLKILSENLARRSDAIITRLDLYDSDIAFEIQQKIEKWAFLIGTAGIILALLAIFIEI